MDLQKMMKDAQNMQKQLQQAQAELLNLEVKGVSGNNLVEITMNGQGELKNIKINKEVVDPNDVETLEDLILSAYKDALKKAEAISKEKLGKIQGGLPPIR